MKTYEKQIIEGGYATHALTDDKGTIYGIRQDEHYSTKGWEEMIAQGTIFRISDVYRYGNSYTIVRRGMLLVSPTPEQLHDYHEQSKVNLHD